MDKDIEILRIKIQSDYAHSRLSGTLALVSSYGIAFLILNTTLLFQNILDWTMYGLSMVFNALWFIIGYELVYRIHGRRLKKLFQQLDELEQKQQQT